MFVKVKDLKKVNILHFLFFSVVTSVPEAVSTDNHDMLGEVFVDTVDTVSKISHGISSIHLVYY